MSKLYVVMKAVNSLLVYGEVKELPEGEYSVPAFLDEEKAKEHSCDGKYSITIMEI